MTERAHRCADCRRGWLVVGLRSDRRCPFCASSRVTVQELSFAELAERQGAGQPIDPDELYDDGATDDEKRAFMAALAELG